MDVSPLYTIHHYGRDMYKVVAFKRHDSDSIYIGDPDDVKHNDKKLASNFSRARSMVLQYALCNPWEYFFTGTLDRFKFNRYNLDVYSSRLMQFIRDMRKKYDAKFQVLLVPELHEDGAWHMHGLIHGLPDDVVCLFKPPAPYRLIKGGYLNWPDYQNKFGFCSLGKIRDPVATAYYVTKYISKDLSQRASDKGKHLYFHSRPLKKAECVSEIYLPNYNLEAFCTDEYEFCKVGMVDEAPWYFPYMWDGVELDNLPLQDDHPVVVRDPLNDFDPSSIDPFYDQMTFSDI